MTVVQCEIILVRKCVLGHKTSWNEWRISTNPAGIGIRFVTPELEIESEGWGRRVDLGIGPAVVLPVRALD